MMPAQDRRKNPPTITVAQLEQISCETDHAARKALRLYTRRALAGFLLLLAGIGFVQYDQRRLSGEAREAIVASARAVAVQGCNRDYRSLVSLRGVLEGARDRHRVEFRKGLIDARVFRAGEAFYAKQLSNLELPDCRESFSVLTDDPGVRIVVPKPLYPKTDG